MLKEEQIKQITTLARLDLEKDELEKYRGQLSDVLDYMEKLGEVETNGVEEMSGGSRELFNVWREDGVVSGEGSGLVDMAPDKDQGQVKVKKILN